MEHHGFAGTNLGPRVIVGADDEGEVLDAVVRRLEEIGADVRLTPAGQWPSVARSVAESVAAGEADFGVLMCWTGTGTSIMANKVRGVRAALCWEPWIAEGARKWNDANVLVMSLKKMTPQDAVATLDAWMSVEAPDDDEAANITSVTEYEDSVRSRPEK